MKNLDFVTYEQALKLKSLGFDWDATHYYECDGRLCEHNISIDARDDEWMFIDISSVIEDGFNKNAFEAGVCDAPTIEQALKWIRKIYKVDIVPKVSVDDEGINRFGYTISRRMNDHSTLVDCQNGFKDYPNGYNEPEEAMLKAISVFFAILEQQYRTDFNPQNIRI